MLLELDFLPFQGDLRLSQSEGKTVVFDPIRRKNIILTPEELLRQLVLQYLLQVKKYPTNRIRVEIGIEVNGRLQRCDLVVFDAAIKPWLLIECKSPKIALKQHTFEQAGRYNMQLKAPYLAITNGVATFCANVDFEKQFFTYLSDFPDLQ